MNILNKNSTNINNNIKISFEFFPPKTPEIKQRFWKSVNQLSILNPEFFSVTYGANLGEKNLTYNTVKKIKKSTGLIVYPHLTCVNMQKQEIINIAKNYWNNNIKHIVALRGDSNEKKKYSTMYGVDLVNLLKKVGDFNIAVAAYPEVHPEAYNAKFDLLNLKNKIDAGANRVITQFFFDVEKYLRFRDRCISIGIDVEITPGIFPIINFSQLKKFAKTTNVHIPEWIKKLFNNININDEFSKKINCFYIAIKMIKHLIKEGVNSLHFYTLNYSEIIFSICKIMNISSL